MKKEIIDLWFFSTTIFMCCHRLRTRKGSSTVTTFIKRNIPWARDFREPNIGSFILRNMARTGMI
jgi:hypothetical protein